MQPHDLTFNRWLQTSYRPIAGGEAVPDAVTTPVSAPPESQPGSENGDGGGEGGEGAQQQQGADLAPVMERMDQMMQRFDGWEQQAEQQPGADPAQQQYDPAALGPAVAEPVFDANSGQWVDPSTGQPFDPSQLGDPAYGDPSQQFADPQLPGQPAVDAQQLDSLIQERVEAATRPIMEAAEANRREVDAQSLLDDYPELQEQETAQSVVAEAQEWAQDLGNPALAKEPAFVELVHLAEKAASAAQAETPAGAQPQAQPTAQAQPGQPHQPQPQQPVQIEGGGGALPGPGATQNDQAERVKAAGARDGFWQ